MSGWQPIETAPRDGTIVLLFAQHAEPPVSIGWFDDADAYDCDPLAWFIIEADGMPSGARPTFWQPLPEPPVIA